MRDFAIVFLAFLLADIVYDSIRDWLKARRQENIAASEGMECTTEDLNQWHETARSVLDRADEILKESEAGHPKYHPLQSLMAFGGSDLTIYFDTVPTGQVTEIAVHENLITEEVEGSFFVTLFEGKEFNSNTYRHVKRIDLDYANEFGFKTRQSITGVLVTGRSQVVTVDDIIIGHRYTFRADCVVDGEE